MNRLEKKYKSIDATKLPEKIQDALKKMKADTKDFSSTDEQLNAKVESALDLLISKLKEKKPEALREVSGKTEPMPKKDDGKKSDDTKKERAKKIEQKEKLDKEAAEKKAKEELEKEKKEREKGMSSVQKLRDLISKDKRLKGYSTKDLQRDASRKAKPKGKRVSGEWGNQYGKTKGGNVYYEYRDNKSDRLAPNYPKDRPLLKEGGEIDDDSYVVIGVWDDGDKDIIANGISKNEADAMVKRFANSRYKEVYSEKIGYKKGGKIQNKMPDHDYISPEYIASIHLKNGKVFNNEYETNRIMSGLYLSDKDVNTAAMDKSQLSLFGQGGKIPKSAVYIPKRDINYIMLDEYLEPSRIEAKNIFNGFWIDQIKQNKLIEEAKKQGRLQKGGMTHSVYLKEGGETDRKIVIVNKGESFDENKYKAVFGDYDKDGRVNIDDAAPANKNINKQVEQVELKTTFKKLLDVKKDLDKTLNDVVMSMDKKAPKNAAIYARSKTPYSIIKKVVDKRLLDKEKGLTDLVGTTIAVDSNNEVKEVAKKIKGGMFGKVLDEDDFFSNPNGGYMAYHFIVEHKGIPVEIQVKTKRMKEMNELSHEFYKDGSLNNDGMLKLSTLIKAADDGDKTAIKEADALLKDTRKTRQMLTTKKLMSGGALDEPAEYKAFYNGKTHIFVADSIMDAKQKAISHFKVPKSKQGLLSVLSVSSIENEDFRYLEKGGQTKDSLTLNEIFEKYPSDKFYVSRTVCDMSNLCTVKVKKIIDKNLENGRTIYADKVVKTYVGQPFGEKYVEKMQKGGKLMSPRERYISEIVGQTGVSKKAVEDFIKENNLKNDEILNIVIGLGRKKLKRIDFVSAVVGKTNNATKKKVLDFAKSDAALRYAKGGSVKRPKSALMRDRKYVNKSEDYEVRYAAKAKKIRPHYLASGGELDEEKQEALIIAQTILQQLGGARRLVAFTGAYNFVATGMGVSFRIKNRSINYVKIKLNGKDLYDVHFSKISGTKEINVKEFKDIYFDQLVELFEKETGMYLSFEDGGEIQMNFETLDKMTDAEILEDFNRIFYYDLMDNDEYPFEDVDIARKELFKHYSDLNEDFDDLPFKKGGKLKQRPKSALMRDRKNLNMSEDYEVRYAKKAKKPRKKYKKRKPNSSYKMTYFERCKKEYRRGEETWNECRRRVSKMMKDENSK